MSDMTTDWTAQREYSRSIFESLQERQTPEKKLVIYPFVVRSHLKGGGTGLAYKYVRTGNSIGDRLARLAQSMGFIE